MPLNRPEVDSKAEFDLPILEFYMQDIETGDRVLCKVSYKFLQDLDPAMAQEAALIIFNAHRPKIEEMASSKYDESGKTIPVMIG